MHQGDRVKETDENDINSPQTKGYINSFVVKGSPSTSSDSSVSPVRFSADKSTQGQKDNVKPRIWSISQIINTNQESDEDWELVHKHPPSLSYAEQSLYTKNRYSVLE